MQRQKVDKNSLEDRLYKQSPKNIATTLKSLSNGLRANFCTETLWLVLDAAQLSFHGPFILALHLIKMQFF